jgi:putative phosphoribosyl transferase
MTLFTNREHAACQLSERLRSLGLSRPIVLGIPRGGIPIAVAIGRRLPDAEVGVIVARKLGAPGNPELAIGAVSSSGAYMIDETLARDTGASARYLETELRKQQAEARRREEQFDGNRRPPLTGRNVILVDDGVATGATAFAAIRAVKAAGASHVCFAVPVGPSDTIRQLRSEADDVVCLHQPELFWAVGQFYQDFAAVEDEEARRLLESVELSSDRPSTSRISPEDW